MQSALRQSAPTPTATTSRIGAGLGAMCHQTQAHPLLRQGMRLVLIIATAGYSMGVAAQAGIYDLSWRPGGRVIHNQGSENEFLMRSLVPVGDRFLLAGRCNPNISNPDSMRTTCVIRINADGSVDTSYGAGGPQFTVGSATGVVSGGRQLAVADPAGRVVLIGGGIASGGLAQIARLSVAGTAVEGPRTFQFHGDISAADMRDVAIAPDGSIVIVGTGDTNPTPAVDSDLVITRLTNSLELDPGFSGDGTVTVAINEVLNGFDAAEAIAIDSAGRLAIAALAGGQASIPQLWVVRLQANGAPVPGFGVEGRVRVPLAGGPVGGIAIDPQGRILVSGTTGVGFAFVVRLLPDGMPDSSFGTSGRVSIDFDTVTNSVGPEQAGNLLVQPDSKIIVGASLLRQGGSPGTTPLFFGLARLTDQGSFDPGFGSNGYAFGVFGPFPLGQFDDRNAFHTMAFDRVGRLMVAGLYGEFSEGSSKRLGLARITTGIVLDPVFANGFEP